jgi:flagellar basal body-associated protein FliL
MKKKRNRIVINLDQKAGAPIRGRSGGIRRVLLIIGLVLLVLVGGVVAAGYFWWRNFQTRPAYTLAVLADATQRKDNATVDSILDTDKITDDFVTQVRQRLTGSAANALWSSQIDSALPSMTPKLRETVHDEIVKELQHLTEPAAGKPFILVALVIGRFADIKQENNTAHAQVNIQHEQLGLTMQSDAGRWRIIAVQDDKLAKEIADAVMRNLPSKGGAQLQDEIRKQLENLKPPTK